MGAKDAPGRRVMTPSPPRMPPPRPRVLVDVSVLGTDSRDRGIGRYVRDLVGGLAAAAPADLALAALENAAWGSRAVVDDDLRAAAARRDAAPLALHRRWARVMRWRAPRVAARRDVALLHLGHPEASPLRRVATPLVITCHDLIPLRFPAHYTNWKRGYGWGQRRLDHRRYHVADHVIAVSQATAHDLVAELEVPAHRITVVPNGVDLDRWSSLPRTSDGDVLRRHRLEGRPYALYVGAGDWRKNVSGMLEGLARARRRPGGSELRLVWAGRLSRRWARDLARGIRARGLSGAVVTTDFVSDDDLAALYRHAALSLFVSRAEGFGYPVVEAMASGCPVVTCGHTSMGEVAGDAAVLVDPEDHDDIATAMLDLVRDPAAREQRRQAGRKRAARFTLQATAEGTLEVYRRLLGI
ncbi:MAG: glycosyltransferase family 1 protein [Myxococcota bacterium]